ncbi:MAG: aminotransferase class III-fold pyridoxal phosphate-dependent enzyme [Planctomycetes bacterium]|nr:aminotransferase class III-fold pyridoxal phosphate-dependent enzyme [Planctomycetota bacterium]
MSMLTREPMCEFTVTGRAAFSSDAAAALTLKHFGLEGVVTPLPAEWDQNFRLETTGDARYVIKIANTGASAELLDLQNQALHRLNDGWRPGMSPIVVPSREGEAIVTVDSPGGTLHQMRVLTWIEGRPLSGVESRDDAMLENIGRALGELDACLADFEHPAMKRDFPWDLCRGQWISSYTGRIPNTRHRRIVERMLLQIRGRVMPRLDELPHSVIHNDANDENILLAESGNGWTLAGLLDFGDMVRTITVAELAIAAAYAILDHDDPLRIIAALTRGYHAARPLCEDEIEVLLPLIILRLCVSVTNSAMAAEEDPDNLHRLITDAPGWAMLERLESIDWREAEDRLRHECGFDPRVRNRDGSAEGTGEKLRAEREVHLGPSLSLAYQESLEIVRGRGQFLFEPNGRAHLDCVNNVCHVGHSHPRVVEAMASQAARLNTNTRYLHPLIIEYAARLTATMPDPLSVCFFVNSGSEANELAVRIARTVTGRRDAIVLENAYHGNTQTLVDLSPYKCEGPGGAGRPEGVHKVEMPDPYRGTHRGRGEDAGIAYAEELRKLCERLVAGSRPPALYIVEPIVACGGQVVPPSGYLKHAFEHVRAVGGLCIADEVQVGMGRAGSHWCVFESMEATPDIVTLGKPIGNGHPLGAVITTSEIAAAFDTGMEYFSTFGGNPVSMAVGMAVMDVIEEEELMPRAERVSAYITAGFRELAQRHPMIGDVRGVGLFMGIELVRDRQTLQPATEETALLIELVKADDILLSAEGPHHNVLKIKPPMQFDETDADLLINAVDRALTTIVEE